MKPGEIIRIKREEMGWTQQELADKLFVLRQTVCRWENGSRLPDIIMSRKIATVLHLSMDELIPSDASVLEREASFGGAKVYAGFDGGGSNTRCMLVSENGKILGRGVGGPSNYLFCGKMSAEEAINESIEKAFQDAGLSPCALEGAFVASAAVEVFCGGEHERFFKKAIRCENVKCDSDIFPVWFAGSRFEPAVAMIAGTGAVTYYLKENTFVKANGWGALFGDEGSGYDIGIHALKAVSRMADGRMEIDRVFYAAVLSHFGVDTDDPRKLLNKVLGGKQRKTVASVAAVVMKLCEDGNQTALEMAENAAEELLASVESVVRELEGPVPLVIWGGLLQNDTSVREKFIAKAEKTDKISHVVTPKQESVLGAAAIALLNAGLSEAAERLMTASEDIG